MNTFNIQNCRICMSPNDVVDINNFLNDSNTKYEDLLNYTIPEIKWESTDYPSKICSKCTDQLQVCTDFKMLCIQSDMIRKKYIEEHASEFGQVEENIEEIVNETTSYSKYQQGDIVIEELGEITKKKSNGKSFIILHDTKNTISHFAPKKKTSRFKCFKCRKMFSNISTFRKHFHQVHDKKEKRISTKETKTRRTNNRGKRPSKFVCTHCKNIFCSKQSLKKHDLSVHKKPFLCNFCSSTFSTIKLLKRHKKMHNYKKQFICQHCGKQFFGNGILNNHLKTHLQNRRFYCCNYCDKQYLSPHGLLTHKQIKHSKSHRCKSFMCHVCGYSTISMSVLKLHLQRHFNGKSFECVGCGMKFVTLRQRKSHEHGDCCVPKKQQKLNLRPRNGKKSLDMKVADNSIVEERKRDEENTKLPLILCQVCDKTFMSEEDVREHLLDVHEIVEYKSYVKVLQGLNNFI